MTRPRTQQGLRFVRYASATQRWPNKNSYFAPFSLFLSHHVRLSSVRGSSLASDSVTFCVDSLQNGCYLALFRPTLSSTSRRSQREGKSFPKMKPTIFFFFLFLGSLFSASAIFILVVFVLCSTGLCLPRRPSSFLLPPSRSSSSLEIFGFVLFSFPCGPVHTLTSGRFPFRSHFVRGLHFLRFQWSTFKNRKQFVVPCLPSSGKRHTIRSPVRLLLSPSWRSSQLARIVFAFVVRRRTGIS